MTMTPERLAELDAVMAKATAGEWGADGVRDNRIVWSGPDTRVCFMAIYPKAHADSLAIVALHNVYPDLRAHIDAQAATIAGIEARIAAECDRLWRIAIWNEHKRRGTSDEGAMREVNEYADALAALKDTAQ